GDGVDIDLGNLSAGNRIAETDANESAVLAIFQIGAPLPALQNHAGKHIDLFRRMLRRAAIAIPIALTRVRSLAHEDIVIRQRRIALAEGLANRWRGGWNGRGRRLCDRDYASDD